MVEQAAVNRKVEGSSPSLGAIFLEAKEGENPRGHKAPVELYVRSRAYARAKLIQLAKQA